MASLVRCLLHYCYCLDDDESQSPSSDQYNQSGQPVESTQSRRLPAPSPLDRLDVPQPSTETRLGRYHELATIPPARSRNGAAGVDDDDDDDEQDDENRNETECDTPCCHAPLSRTTQGNAILESHKNESARIPAAHGDHESDDDHQDQTRTTSSRSSSHHMTKLWGRLQHRLRQQLDQNLANRNEELEATHSILASSSASATVQSNVEDSDDPLSSSSRNVRSSITNDRRSTSRNSPLSFWRRPLFRFASRPAHFESDAQVDAEAAKSQQVPFLKSAEAFDDSNYVPTIAASEVVVPGSKLQKAMALAAALTLDEEQGDECVICMETFDPTNPRMPTLCGCGQNKTYFHLPCLYQWIDQDKNCPSCRKKLRWEEF